MKLIHNFKSPNFNDRKSNNVEIIVIHYTALDSISNSLKYLCSKKTKLVAIILFLRVVRFTVWYRKRRGHGMQVNHIGRVSLILIQSLLE